MHKYSFEKLEVWNLAKGFVKEIHLVTKTFPSDERFGLVSQINRAAVSVASTLAEGTSRASQKDQSHFSNIAYGSLMEVACQLIISFELGYITDKQHDQLRKAVEVISNKLNALRNYQLGRVPQFRLNNSTSQRLNK